MFNFIKQQVFKVDYPQIITLAQQKKQEEAFSQKAGKLVNTDEH